VAVWVVSHHSRELAAEIVQETFLRVAKSARRFKGRSTFSTWLFSISRSAAIDLARRERRQRVVCDEGTVLRLVSAMDDAAEPCRTEDARSAVRSAVAKLPAAQRDAIVLCELTGFSIVEAADVLGWGQSRVKVTLFRARRKLRDLLGENVHGESVKETGSK
jgi:RNA polymerase sigma-70 factor (ECF subfamily)